MRAFCYNTEIAVSKPTKGHHSFKETAGMIPPPLQPPFNPIQYFQS